MSTESEIQMFSKYVNPTMSSHPCDLCEELVERGSRSHYVNGRANGEYFSGWQHVTCWQGLMCGEIAAKEPSIPLLIARLLEPR